MLEVLIGFGVDFLPASFQLLRIEGPDLPVTRVEGNEPPELVVSRARGDAWLAARDTALADVPSIVAPFGRNLLLNPLHPDAAQFKIVYRGRYPWDRRLFR